MKVKIYPLEKPIKTIDAFSSFYCSLMEIICASLASGTSIIYNVSCGESIETAINWCQRIGANIIKDGNTLKISGINNSINFKSPLFECNNVKLAFAFIPLLSSVPFPIGIKANESVKNQILVYKDVYEAYGIEVYVEDDLIRLEKKMESKKMNLPFEANYYFVSGLLLAFPLLDNSSKLKIKETSNLANYDALFKIMNKFGVDAKYKKNVFEIRGNQYYKATKIYSEIDRLLFSYNALLPFPKDGYIKINHFYHQCNMDGESVFEYTKKNIYLITKISKSTILRKRYQFYKNKLVKYEFSNSLPLLMCIGALNPNDFTITDLDFSKPHLKRHYEIMSEAFKLLNIPFVLIDNELKIGQLKESKKVQIDCKNDSYCLFALTYLALSLNEPLIIKNAECYHGIHGNLFDVLTASGVKIEYIYD